MASKQSSFCSLFPVDTTNIDSTLFTELGSTILAGYYSWIMFKLFNFVEKLENNTIDDISPSNEGTTLVLYKNNSIRYYTRFNVIKSFRYCKKQIHYLHLVSVLHKKRDFKSFSSEAWVFLILCDWIVDVISSPLDSATLYA